MEVINQVVASFMRLYTISANGVVQGMAYLNLTSWSLGMALLVLGATLVLAFLWSMRPEHFKGVATIPYNPIVGHMFLFAKNMPRIYDFMLDNAKQCYPAIYYTMCGAPPVVYCYSPANVEYFLKTAFDSFEKGPIFRDYFLELLGEGIFQVDGDAWREQRKTASHMFSHKVLREDMFRVFCEHGQTVCELLSTHAKQVSAGVTPTAVGDSANTTDNTVDMQSIYFKYTMDCITEIAFGQNIDTLRRDAPFGRAFDATQMICQDRMYSIILVWKLKRLLNVGKERALKQHVAIIRSFADDIIRKRKEVQQQTLSKYPDLLSRFISEARERGEEPTYAQLRDVILNFMIAGRDTTACLLSWATYELGKHPEEAQKLRTELARVRAAHPSSSSATTSNGSHENHKFWQPTFEQVSDMPYMEAFLKEVLRLHPSVPIDGMYAAKDEVLPDGQIHIKKGWSIGFSPYVMSRLPQVWGPDAEEFKVSRWLDETKPTAFEYPHFKAGPRICLGQHVAILEAKTLFSMLLASFELQLSARATAEYQLSIVMPMLHGCPVTVRPLKS